MSYTFNESTNSYIVASNLNDNEVYDTLLSIAKANDLIDANQASDTSHLLSILNNNSIEVEFELDV